LIKIIIAGSKTFNDFSYLENRLLDIARGLIKDGYKTHNNIEIISGTARGADKLGENLAELYDLKLSKFPANWDLYGKSAGYIRNEEMAKYAKEDNGILIAFWDGESKGTSHMIDLAIKHTLKVRVVGV
jgi:hypothetical protein